MKTKFFTLFFALVASVGTMFAEEVQIGHLYYILDATNKTAKVTYESQSSNNYHNLTSIDIPASVAYEGKTYSVTSIGSGAFYWCCELASVTIPNSVTEIGWQAFYYCQELTAVTMGNGVISIGKKAFFDCYKLKSVTFGNSVTSIGESAFYGCSGLTNVEIPNSVTSIGNSAFYTCYRLTSVTLGDRVTSIGSSAFRDCSDLASVIIPNSVTEIGEYAFGGCKKLTSVAIGNSVTELGGGAFSGCTSLSDITIPNSVTSIGGSAFHGCTSLTSITIGNSVKTIGSSAFKGCENLNSIILPSSLSKIEKSAFYGCTGLTSITCRATLPPVCGEESFEEVNRFIPLYVPSQSIEYYKNATIWSEFYSIQAISGGTIDDGQSTDTTTVAGGDFVFVSNQNSSTIGLTSLASHQTLEYSTDGTRWYPMTTSTTIPLNNGASLYVRGKLTGNNTIEDYTQFTITGSVAAKGNINCIWDYENLNAPLKERCGWRMFRNCEGLSDVTQIALPATILANACYQDLFFECTNIHFSPQLPATIMAQECYRGMFVRCTNLEVMPLLPSIALADSCYMDMFSECSNLKTISALPASVLTPKCYSGMFYGCTSLTSAPQLSATTLAASCYANMFEGCTNLTSAPALPATTLANWCYYRMFFGCKSLETAPALPAATLTSGCYYKMLKQCTNLKNIKCLATDISADQCLTEWVKTVSSSGTFVKHHDMNSWPSGMNGIPNGWTVNGVVPYTIYFDANGGVIPTSGNMGTTPANNVSELSSDRKTGYVVVYSGDASFSEMRSDCPTCQGHTFLGWFTDKTGGVQVYDATGMCVNGSYWDASNRWIGTTDLQLYAQWSINSYTITWLQDDGSLIDRTAVLYGQMPTHAAPTKEPTSEYTYTFAGWYPEVVVVTGSATYIATYSINAKSYTVTYLDWDGTELYVEQVEEGHDAVGPPTVPSRDGYTFIGWSRPLSNIQSNLIVVAQYELNTSFRDVRIDNLTPFKFIHNSQLLIQQGDKTYNAQGARVK